MNTFDQNDMLKNRLSAYQQSVLSVMGISQWHIRGVESHSNEVADNNVDHSNPADLAPQQEQQKKTASSINALRDALSPGAKVEPKQESLKVAVSSEVKVPTKPNPPTHDSVKELEPGLHLLFEVHDQERGFVDDVISSVKGETRNVIRWRLGGSIQLEGGELLTPPVSAVMRSPKLKRQLWYLLYGQL